MGYKLRKSGVLTGYLNSFCLACDSLLKSEQEANEHIVTSLHEENLNVFSYLDKFKDEYIRKFKNGYFCEFCNLLLPIAAKVNLHITEDEHKQNKGIHLLKPMGRDVVAFNDILIEENVWHGLMEEICSLCNIEFEDEEEHKSDTNHSLNLVLKPLIFGPDDAIFRQIDKSAVQCLTCNKLLAPDMVNVHSNEDSHRESIRKLGNFNNFSENIKDHVETSEKLIEPPSNNDFKDDKIPEDKKSKILESLAKYQSKGININLETETAFCKKCSEVITFEFIDIENHIENHLTDNKINSDLLYPSILDPDLNRVDINDKSTNHLQDLNGINDEADATTKELPDISSFEPNGAANDSTEEEDNSTSSSGIAEKCNGKYDLEAKDYAKKHKITYNEGNSNAYCRICKVKLPSPLKSMQEHVAGATHKKLTKQLKSTQIKPPVPESAAGISKTETRHFIESAYTIEGLLSADMVVNEKYCIPLMSFWMITKNDSRLRCLLCDMYLMPNSDAKTHANTRLHEIRLGLTPVVTSDSSEYIREIQPGAYHCGFCHLVVSSWADMKQHLKCSEHKEKKRLAEIRLERHLPDLQEYKMFRHVEAMRILWLLNHFSD